MRQVGFRAITMRHNSSPIGVSLVHLLESLLLTVELLTVRDLIEQKRFICSR